MKTMNEEFPGFPDLSYLGKLKTRKSTEITSSRLGVGFETLDRQMWDPEQAWPVLNDLGVKWARVQTGWARSERVPGVYDFGWLDEVVDKLLARGVHPWLSFSYGNPVYSPESSETGVGYPPIRTEGEREGWRNFVGALTAHFRDRVSHYEVWNEPDLTSFWKPLPRASDYVDLVRITAGAVREKMPEAKIIGGAIAWGMTVWSLKFLEDCCEQGMHELIDIVTYHGYKSVPERHSAQEFAAFYHLLQKYKPSLIPWQGESGMQSRLPEGGNAGALAQMVSSEAIQARMLLRRFLLELHNGCQMSSYFHMADFAHYAGDRRTYHYGLIRLEDGTPKDAYRAMQTLATLLCDDEGPANGRTACHMSVLADADDPRATKVPTWHANFVRGNVPVHSWWLPESVTDDPVIQRAEMAMWIDLGLHLEDAVLIEPVSQSVYALPFGWDKRTCAETWMSPDPDAQGVRVFKSLPVSSSPLILTDRSIIELR